jgi:hypothetical protein
MFSYIISDIQKEGTNMKRIMILIVTIMLLITGCLAPVDDIDNSDVDDKMVTTTTQQNYAPDDMVIGGDRDENGCLSSAGYQWCEEKQKCLKEWEEPCASILELPVDVYYCSEDSECAPEAACHPKRCMNKNFINIDDKPEICTMQYDETAAYSEEDCICTNNECRNKMMPSEDIISKQKCKDLGGQPKFKRQGTCDDGTFPVGIIDPITSHLLCCKEISDFRECVRGGNPIMESFPRQCSSSGKSFTEEI